MGAPETCTDDPRRGPRGRADGCRAIDRDGRKGTRGDVVASTVAGLAWVGVEGIRWDRLSRAAGPGRWTGGGDRRESEEGQSAPERRRSGPGGAGGPSTGAHDGRGTGRKGTGPGRHRGRRLRAPRCGGGSRHNRRATGTPARRRPVRDRGGPGPSGWPGHMPGSTSIGTTTSRSIAPRSEESHSRPRVHHRKRVPRMSRGVPQLREASTPRIPPGDWPRASRSGRIGDKKTARRALSRVEPSSRTPRERGDLTEDNRRQSLPDCPDFSRSCRMIRGS